MKVSLNWLKNYVSLDGLTIDEIENKITLLGLEVDDIIHVGSNLNGVVVGKVLTCIPHPDADRLKLTTVDVGASEPVSIVCGAPNVAVGQLVPVATVGTTLPIEIKPGEFLTIKKSKIRGQVSEGMICAVDELGLGEDHSGILVLNTDKEAGTPISEVLTTNADVVFELSITPNRPDATCHIGVARDLAAVLNRKLSKPDLHFSADSGLVPNFIQIEIKAPEKCPRYTAKVIKNVTIKESPTWLQNYLRAIGLRPINNVVDATNFVMYEYGQPLHAFDLKEISSGKIVVQDFSESIDFITLDSQSRKIPAGSLFICDGNRPVALAGIMGGENSEIKDDTKDVLLETAYFEPTGIRKTAKQTSLHTDSSYRFERGIDPNMTLEAAERCAQLIAELSNADLVEGTLDINPIKTEPKQVNLSADYVNKILGTSYSMEIIVDVLKRLQFTVEYKMENLLSVTVPTFRPDIDRPIDLVEEVARVLDYNTIASPTHTAFHTPSPYPFHETFTEKNRRKAVALGLTEIYCNSLLPESYAATHASASNLVRTMNPISKDLTYLRDSLQTGFLKTIAFNANRGNHSLSLFEIGHVFELSDSDATFIDGIKEHVHIGIGLSGFKFIEQWNQKSLQYQFSDLKSLVNAWLNSLRLPRPYSETVSESGVLHYHVGNESIGSIKVIHPKQLKSIDLLFPVYFAEFDLTVLENLAQKGTEFKAIPIPKYPSVEFDLALVTDLTVSVGELTEVLVQSAGKMLQSYHVFDIFEGGSLEAGKKSVAYRLVFLNDQKTLSMQEVEPIIQKILKKLNQRFGATLRS